MSERRGHTKKVENIREPLPSPDIFMRRYDSPLILNFFACREFFLIQSICIDIQYVHINEMQIYI